MLEISYLIEEAWFRRTAAYHISCDGVTLFRELEEPRTWLSDGGS